MSASCRLAGEMFSLAEFRSIACARCLLYIYLMVPPFQGRYETLICEDGLLVCDREDTALHSDCRCDNPNAVFNLPSFGKNRSHFSPLSELSISPRLPADFAFITQQCCEAADRCCQNVLTKRPETPATTVTQTVKPRCPATWDGWQCFPESDPGIWNYKCPNYIYGDRLRNDIDPLNGVLKECTDNGSWYAVHVDGQSSEWTDYRLCITDNASTLKMAAGLLAFTITAVCILPAVAFISTHRVLYSQPVFIIHKHLLASFLIASLTFIFNCVFFVVEGAPGDHLYFSNHFSCRLLFTVQLRYFRLTTFTWMLAEGVYLYRLLSPFEYNHENLRPYKVACWGAPMLLTIVYSILRQTMDNDECWVSPSEVWWLEWGFMMGPCLVLICTNLVLLTLIMCVVIKKIRFNPHMEKAQYTKALRAAIFLVPVFGLHFLLTIYRIQSSHTHQIVNLILDGLQGAAVSFIVCYQNKTFQECMAKTLRRHGLVQSAPNKEKPPGGTSFHKEETDRFLRSDAVETNFGDRAERL